MDRNQLADMLFVSLANLCLTNQSDKLLLLSSIEAEYIATTEAGNEALLIARFLACLGYWLPDQPVGLTADNRRAILLTANPESHRRTKHIEVPHHWIRKKVESKEIVITYISTTNMVADGLTKGLNPKTFKVFWTLIGMYWIGSNRMTEWECWKCNHTLTSYRTSGGGNAS